MNTTTGSFEETLRAALEAMKTNDSVNARKLLFTAMELGPQSAIPPFLLACEYAENREYDQAEGAFIAALQLQPDLAIARFQLGLLQMTSARPAAAFATWGPLEELGEGHALRLFKVGLELLAQDQFDQAIATLRRGMEANEDNAPLNRDMQMMIDAIQAHLNGVFAVPDGGDATGEASGTAHFLLSKYRTLQ